MQDLVKKFAEAGLYCEVWDRPLMKGTSADIFAMTIKRGLKGNQRKEYFQIYPGHETNIVQVMNTDKKFGQLVLMVKEIARTFERSERIGKYQIIDLEKQARKEGIENWQDLLRNQAKARNTKILRIVKDGKAWEIFHEDRTPGSTRYYLCGIDERQLFIAQVPKHITTVAMAHKELKGATVETADGKAPGRTIRQGEFFFLNLSPEELRALNEDIRKKRAIVKSKIAIGEAIGHPSANPHTADELISYTAPVLEHGFPVNRERNVYVRGSVRHRDHATVKFGSWRKVLKNNEAELDGARRGSNGIFWID